LIEKGKLLEQGRRLKTAKFYGDEFISLKNVPLDYVLSKTGLQMDWGPQGLNF
jgi:hypothetical protein